MIEILENKLFHLSGEQYSYLFYVNEVGALQQLYFGAKITADGEYLLRYGAALAPDKDNWNYDMDFDIAPSEYAFFARGDFREPSVLARRGDGSIMTRFRYQSHSIKKGVKEVNGMPHARSGGETLTVILKDDFSPLEVALNYTVFETALVRNAELKNTGKESIALTRAFSFCLDLPDSEYELMRLYGTWGAERTPERTKLGHGITRLQSLRGTSSHQLNPFLALLRTNTTEEEGECYGFELIYSGSYALTAEVATYGSLRVQGGINDVAFSWQLGGGESFFTPQAILTYSANGLGGLSRSLHDFLRDHVINPQYVKKCRPIVVNNWEATYFDFDNEKLYAIIDEAAPLGIDTFVLDDGWFGKRDDDSSGLGDWFVNEKKLQGGLDSVIDRCKKNGLRFGLWFEPEMVCEDSDLYRAHPDWAIGKEGVTPCRARNQLVLDYSRPEVVEHIYGMMEKILSKHDISYVKWDMNRNITEYFASALPAERQGELIHRYILGVYSLAERLTSSFPNVFFEGCASGGARFDAGMLYYFPQIWTSDDTDAYERAKIEWGTSVAYPPSAMSCHVSVCPNHQTARSTPFDTRGVIASLGATGYELDLSKMSEEDKQKTKEQVARYREIHSLILEGDLYRLSSPFTENYFVEMIVSKDKSVAYVAGERMRGVPLDTNRLVRLKGLACDKKYRIRELGLTASGKTLSSLGVLLPRIREYESFTWHLQEVK